MLVKRKIKKVSILVALLATNFMLFSIKSNADEVLNYRVIDNNRYIDIVALAKIEKEQIQQKEHKTYGKGYELSLNNKTINIYKNLPCVFIDKKMVALSTQTVNLNDMEYNLPIMQSIIQKNNELLVPVFIIEKLGFKCDDKGVVIEKEEESKIDTSDYEEDYYIKPEEDKPKEPNKPEENKPDTEEPDVENPEENKPDIEEPDVENPEVNKQDIENPDIKR